MNFENAAYEPTIPILSQDNIHFGSYQTVAFRISDKTICVLILSLINDIPQVVKISFHQITKLIDSSLYFCNTVFAILN